MIAKKTNTESTKQVSHKNKVLRNKYRFILNTLDFLFWGEGETNKYPKYDKMAITL